MGSFTTSQCYPHLRHWRAFSCEPTSLIPCGHSHGQQKPPNGKATLWDKTYEELELQKEKYEKAVSRRAGIRGNLLDFWQLLTTSAGARSSEKE